MNLETTVESFLAAATSGCGDRARRLLEARPEIAADPWAGLVLGTGWSGDASAPGGPLGWAPLLYVAHSCFAPVDLARDLLARGADPNEEHWALLVHAVRRGCGTAMLRLLAEHGAELDRRVARGPRGRGARARRGAGHAAARRARRRRAGDGHPRRPPRAPGDGRRGPRPELLRPRRRRAPSRLLHHACWVGDPVVVDRLLELGADPVGGSGTEVGPPIAWAVHGSQYHGIAGRDYVAVVQRLLAAGGQLEPRFLDLAEGPLAEWLEEERS